MTASTPTAPLTANGAAAVGAADPTLRSRIEDFYYSYAWYCDQIDHEAWLGCFAAGGEYLMTTRDNDRGGGLLLVVDRGHEALKERLAFIAGYWNVNRSKTTHAITNVRVLAAHPDSIEVRAVLAMYKTGRDGASRFHVAGEYRDTLSPTQTGFEFLTHYVVLDGETLPNDLTDLL